MVAYAYAATYPSEVEKLVVMDAFLSGVQGWEPYYNSPDLWHFRFHGPTPEALTISSLFDQGKLSPHVGSVLPLQEVSTAHRMLAGAPHKPGKIVLDVAV